MTCPSESEILVHALEPAVAPDSTVARHICGCESCRSRVEAIRRVAREIELAADTREADRSSCLDEIELVQLIVSGSAEDRRPSRIEHLVHCGRCRGELAALVRLLAAPEVEAEVRRIERAHPPRFTHRWRVVGAALAAAAVALVAIQPWSVGPSRQPAHRAPTITSAAPPALLSPVGSVDRATVLRWAAIAGSDRYRVTLFDAEGQVLLEAQLGDTAIALPASVVLVPARPYLWKVEARTGFERWVSSPLVEFTVRRTGAR